MRCCGNSLTQNMRTLLVLAILYLVLPISNSHAQGNSGWQQFNIGASGTLWDIDFINQDTGWIAGIDGLFRTSDRGASWLAWGLVDHYQRVQFVDSRNGWAMLLDGVRHTSDGGQSWWDEKFGSYNLSDYVFLNADTGIAIGQGFIYRTTDGGNNAQLVHSEGGANLRKVCVIDSINMIAVGDPLIWENRYPALTVFLYSSDNGITWVRKAFDTIQQTVLTINSLKNHILIGGEGMLATSSDYGASWNYKSMGSLILDGSYLSAAGNWYMVGEDNLDKSSVILVSIDSGRTWTRQQCPNVGVLYGIWFPTPVVGYSVGVNGAFLQTTTGGFASVGATQPPEQNLPIQVFPNPSQGQVQFRYDLPKAESVTLRIYNTTGQLISTPLSEARQTPGAQQVRLATGALAAGDYVFLLQSEDYIQSGRFVVVK